MRTSRIARETAKTITRTSNDSHNSFVRPQTRSFAATLQAYAAIKSPGHETEVFKPELVSEDESSLSSISSTAILDIEDIASPIVSPRKRKREPVKISHESTRVTIKSIPRASSHESSLSIENEPVRKRKKAKRQPAKGIVNEAGEVEIRPPANWEKIYDTVKEMRKSVLAPVDTMGCETLAQESVSPRVLF